METRYISYFLLHVYWIQKHTGSSIITALVPNSVVALGVIGPKSTWSEYFGLLTFSWEKSHNNNLFLLFLKKATGPKTCGSFREDIRLEVQENHEYKPEIFDDFHSLAQDTVANGNYFENIDSQTFSVQQN